KVADGVLDFPAVVNAQRKLRVGCDQFSIAEKFENAAFVERDVKLAIVAALDEQARVFEMNRFASRNAGILPAFFNRCRRDAGVPWREVLPRKQITPRVMPDDVIVRITRRKAVCEAAKKL